MRNKEIIVSKISLESLNRLVDLGYTVRVSQIANKKSVYANYKYNRPIEPSSTLVDKIQPNKVSATVCTVPHLLREATRQ